MKWWLIVVSAVLVGCAGVPVDTDYNTDYDYAAVGSYAWLPRPEPGDDVKSAELYNDLSHQRVKAAVDQQFRARGYELVESVGDASVLVTYHLGLEDKTRIDNFGSWYTHFGYYPCYHCVGRPGFGTPYFHDDDLWVRQYQENTLIIDLVDPKTKQLLWRGSSKRNQPRLETPEERRLFVLETVAAILEQFPPGRQVSK